ncbi:MAG: sugar ABC transporter ATP-binding protein [Eubacteriales bacterium]
MEDIEKQSANTVEYSVVVQNVNKTFGDIKVLSGVNFSIKKGEIYALCGSNGAGKSTIVKILSGVYEPDDGAVIKIGENEYGSFKTPIDSKKAGVRVVHQEAPLISTLTVAECVAVNCGYPKSKIGNIDWKSLKKQTKELLEKWGIDLDVDMLANELTAAQRAMLGLAIALNRHPGEEVPEVLIVDEVTASMSETEDEQVMEIIKKIAESGQSVIMITHRLDEVINYANRVMILSDGYSTFEGKAKEYSVDFLVEKMLEGNISNIVSVDRQEELEEEKKEELFVPWEERKSVRTRNNQKSREILNVKELSGDSIIDVSFQVKTGEIVGIAGLLDSGVTEIPGLLTGNLKRKSGDIFIKEEKLSQKHSMEQAIKYGMGLVPGDRLTEGGLTEFTIQENLFFPLINEYWNHLSEEKKITGDVIKYLDVKTPSSDALFGKLSGGNQQKVIMGKWLLTAPELLILQDPTVGVDMGARQIIYKAINDYVRAGNGALVVSSDFDEIAKICSRVIVVKGGRIIDEIAGAQITRTNIMKLAYGEVH